MITKKYYKLIRVSHADEGYFYIKNVSNEVGEFSINNYTSGTMEYSLDGVTWTSYDLTNKPTVNVNPNSNIYLRGTNFKHSSSGNVLSFNKSYNICGNFMSVSNYSTMSSVTEIDSDNIIRGAFYNQTNLVSAADLNFGNVTTIGQNGLETTFQGCSSLINTPDLSHITSVGSSGLSSTFRDCTSLETCGDFSNITSVASTGMNNCYQGCSKLSTIIAPNVSTWTETCFTYWVYQVGTSATGTKTFYAPSGVTIPVNQNGQPYGWTRADY